ncbi:ATP synthase subunit I [Thioalkalivibrio sp. XN8]|uniref:N-ATPase subunit AtpR n=1 Tax=Thioalkalivibrio sp. XN8 TaxID=2712863 RepID=UPI0013ECC6A0|nr:ATP synthase subunit I [Thioalkalivibrio sp. XN8]
MTDAPVMLGVAAAAGLVVGLAFYGALGWTAARLATSPNPGRLMLASMLLRFAFVLGCLYAVAIAGGWTHLLATAGGLAVARLALPRLGPARLSPGGGP